MKQCEGCKGWLNSTSRFCIACYARHLKLCRCRLMDHVERRRAHFTGVRGKPAPECTVCKGEGWVLE
jgi:hypothetical protein